MSHDTGITLGVDVWPVGSHIQREIWADAYQLQSSNTNTKSAATQTQRVQQHKHRECTALIDKQYHQASVY